MPVREKVVDRLCKKLVGGYYYEHGEVRGMPTAMHDLLYTTVDAAYDSAVRAVDWNRVYWDARSRHTALHTRDDKPSDLSLKEPGTDVAEVEEVEETPVAAKSLDDPYFFREDSVCPECLMESMLHIEWGGKSDVKWADKPTAPRWSFPNWRRKFPEQRDTILRLMAERWERPEPAGPEHLSDDGHLPMCREVGGPRDSRILCDPRCPQYDGRLERLTEDSHG